ncbi:tRNA (adenosine(37)-N6)-threonylcarbamoyltransferase complex dimerization subunit type 1 TsaB [Coxiella endosymbiont of Amblyomma americanum]|uniref:tRNA (adenosine(37)-N6)-threonylcarbamoyltransferase complex dimerization subunit type 1 TsaB n=1 Tax=Coxiella endosymbiont of Amblyomma americanum TaxID=325775 RepID=UPI00057ECEA7|nr:tRNA (adenosine(37)-N6)-threonylcarbamoyltransferase complex dimerization subunit type 1 TsaB [Coxiella endosymbiont of Amblyomma americanum]AJC50522.1 peptidase M22 [Coxiella endosymbiont of Amblyomma americanum]AUJ58857.1 tRNA (adenosine(37)-N6)-threonylcarbamoyltransferase complex dimerization subunit type 1 TsaB [Coxiella-like endosymbiont of Amblyomma americanum]
MTKLLALETATVACSVALWIDGDITQRFEIAPQRHSDILLNLVDTLLNNVQITLQDLDAIAFGSGPGSFIGVRIATGIAQGIAYAMDLPIIPVSTLQALAQAAYQQINNESIVSGWDARMNSIYWGVYKVDSEKIMQTIISDHVDYPIDIRFPKGKWAYVGNAWSIYQSILPMHCQPIKKDIYPNAASVAIIAHQKFNKGDILSPEEVVEPTYIRERIVNFL